MHWNASLGLLDFLPASWSDFTGSSDDDATIRGVTVPGGPGNQHFRPRSLGWKNGSSDKK